MQNFEKNDKYLYKDLKNFYQTSTKYLNKPRKLSFKYPAFPNVSNFNDSYILSKKMVGSETYRSSNLPNSIQSRFTGNGNKISDSQLIDLDKRIQNLNFNFNSYGNIGKPKHRFASHDNFVSKADYFKKSPRNSDYTNDTSSTPKRNYKHGKDPMDSLSALQKYRSQLTSLEQNEILNYSEVWYLGLNACKTETIKDNSPNNGYDDEDGAYIKVPNDHIAYRYEVLETLGKGSFGQVFKAMDHKTGQLVAIKVIRNKSKFHQQSLIEIQLLNFLNEKERKSKNSFYVIHLRESFIFRNHPCLVFELQGENLYDVIRKKSFSGFSMQVIQKIGFSILQCLSILRRENIIHCDLKPENILLINNENFDIKIIDFGSSCFGNKRIYTYIQSRFYRSPEIILGVPYTTQIDMWSFGCLIPELLTRRPLFPGETEIDQLACMMEMLGTPPKSLLDKSKRKQLFFNNKGDPKYIINSKGKKRVPNSKTLISVIKTNLDPSFMGFILNCLEWDPEMRIFPDQALRHPWFGDLRRGDDRNGNIFPRRIKHQNTLKDNSNRDSSVITDDLLTEKMELPSIYR